MAKPADARLLYQAELAAPGGMRGEAGARLVDLEYAEGGRNLQEWTRCEGFLRSELDDGGRFKDNITQLSKFHRAVKQWLRSHPVAPEQHQMLLRKTRQSLLHAVRESQIRNQEAARGDVVADLSELLEETGDPLSLPDLRKGLTITAVPTRPRQHRRLIGSIRPVADGRCFCWSRDQWAWMDSSGGSRTEPRRLPSLPQSLALHPRPEGDGAVSAAMITHDHRLTLMRFTRSQVEVTAVRPLPGALCIVAEQNPPGFLIGTSDGSIYQAALAPSHRLTLSRYREGENENSIQSLDWWGSDPVLFCTGRLPQVSLSIIQKNPEYFEESPRESFVGSVERVAIHEQKAFCYGREARFGLFAERHGYLDALEAQDIPAVGVTALGFFDSRQVAIGYQDGRVVIAELREELPRKPGLHLQGTLRTSLGPIVALQGLPFGRAVALDADFKCAILDTRGHSLVHEGSWVQAG
jgi:hypothetical protein